MLKRFWNEEEGFGTVELVVLIGILVAIALIFRNYIIDFVANLMKKTFDDDAVNTMKVPDPTVPTP